MNPFWFLRMKRWAQHPPSWGRVLLVLGIVAFCAALYGLERFGMLPDWMQAERMRGRVLR